MKPNLSISTNIYFFDIHPETFNGLCNKHVVIFVRFSLKVLLLYTPRDVIDSSDKPSRLVAKEAINKHMLRIRTDRVLNYGTIWTADSATHGRWLDTGDNSDIFSECP